MDFFWLNELCLHLHISLENLYLLNNNFLRLIQLSIDLFLLFIYCLDCFLLGFYLVGKFLNSISKLVHLSVFLFVLFLEIHDLLLKFFYLLSRFFLRNNYIILTIASNFCAVIRKIKHSLDLFHRKIGLNLHLVLYNLLHNHYLLLLLFTIFYFNILNFSLLFLDHFALLSECLQVHSKLFVPGI